MIQLIAQAAPPVATPLSAAALLIAVMALLGIVRILYILDGDLKSSQPVLSDPIGFAVRTSSTYADISANNWQGLRAVVAAHQLQEYMLRYGWLLKTQVAYGLCLVLVVQFVALFVAAGIAAPGTPLQDYILKGTGVVVLLWTVLIEKCKAMKKAVESLRVT